MSSIKRIQKELKDLNLTPPEGISAGLADQNSGNIRHLTAYIVGPKDSPYEGGCFQLDIKIPNEYPFKPPTTKFVTKIYHCNINNSGDICLDILKDQWSPALTISRLLLSISSLMADPNPNDPLFPDAAHLYKHNKPEYDRMAKEYTIKYANK